AVRRVGKQQGEFFAAAGRSEIRRIPAENPRDPRQTERLDIATDETAAFRVLLHEEAEARTARQSLHAERAGTGEQVDHLGAHERKLWDAVGEDVEHGLPHTVRGWPQALVAGIFRRRQRPAAEPASDNSHRPSSSAFGPCRSALARSALYRSRRAFSSSLATLRPSSRAIRGPS